MSHCACLIVVRLDGDEAIQYAREHLRHVLAGAPERDALYRCPHSGALWRLTRRGGEPELTRIHAMHTQPQANA